MSTDLATYTPATDLAPADPTGGRLVAWAEAASAANQLARALSQTTFVPKEMTNVGNATAAILAGDEVGLSPLAALRSIYVVHGTPAFYARTMVALAQSHGHEIWTTESTDQKVTVQGRRRGSDHIETVTWTIQRAQKAGYTSNKKYSTNAQEMLYSKAAAEVARKISADVLSGMAYSVEDLELEDAPTATVTRAATGEPRKVSRKKPSAPEPAEPSFGDSAEPTPEPEQAEQPEHSPEPDGITQAQTKKLGVLMRELDMTDRADALAWVGNVIGREIGSRNELTKAEASQTIDHLQGLVDQVRDAEGSQITELPAGDGWPEAAGGETS